MPQGATWFDLPVVDLADAMSFYEGLFNWTFRQMDRSPLADYVMVEAGGHLIGGLRKIAPRQSCSLEPAPIVYFPVDELALKVTRAKELGAHLVGATIALGGNRGNYQWLRDREGHLIGLWAAR